VLVPGLSYALDNGTEAASAESSSDFVFSLDAAGMVSTSSAAATGSGNTLTLNAVPVQINPGAYSAAYYVQSLFPAPLSGPMTISLMPGLLYAFDDGAEVGGSSFLFDVDPSGDVSTTSSAASAAGGTLTLDTIVVHVDDPSSTTYTITGYPNLSSSADVVLISGLQAYLTGASDTVFFAPSPAVQVSIPGVTVTGPSAYSATVQSPIKQDGSSVFKSNRGVVPVKFTLSQDGASTCQLPGASISLIRTSGSVAGMVNESAYQMPSDTGSIFRIDSCQYVYNLGTSALGAGPYLLQISVNGAVIGSARFGLN